MVAPGYYAQQDMRTPMWIAIAVLILTQVLNFFLVPLLQHAALTLSISIGAVVNALWLLVGLIRRGSYKPEPGWGIFLLRVVAASTLLASFLLWAAGSVNWLGMKADYLQKIGLLALVLLVSAAIYFVALKISGMKLRQLIRR